MPYQQDISRCLAKEIGESGLKDDELDLYLEKAWHAVARLRGQYEDGSLPFLHLPEREDDLVGIVEAARQIAEWPAVAVIGAGGSSLGGRCLAELNPDGAPWPGFGMRPAQCFFVDNVDPANYWLAPGARDFSQASVLAVSKSGHTMETMAQLLHLWGVLSGALGAEEAALRFLLVTEPSDNPMRRFGERHGMRILDHDPGIGGRYSVLSLVGLLPGILTGRDPEAVRAGAATVLRNFLEADKAADIPPALGAALNLGLTEDRGVWNTIMCPYADALAPFAHWYAQLWAESLGKDEWGSTPYPARGAVDQHSQLQLWLDGPRDKLVNILTIAREGIGAALPETIEDKELGYLAGRTIGDVMAAEQRATIDTLAERGVPVRHFALGALDERTLGALFMHFMLETVLAGYMLDIDPFDQPAVENGKRRARKYLSEMSSD